MEADVLAFSRLKISTAELPFRFAFTHAGASRKSVEVLILELTNEQGTTGHGEVITRSYLTGETRESAADYIKDRVWPELVKLHLNKTTRPDTSLRTLYEMADKDGATAAYSGVDLAVFDAWSRHFRIPGNQILGTPSATQTPLTAPISLGLPPRFTALALRAVGFSTFKVKVGADVAASVNALRRVRSSVGCAATLCVDANGAWALRDLSPHLSDLKQLNIACIEQPLGREKYDEWHSLAKLSPIPLMADESLCNQSDAKRLIPLGKNVQWNIRVAKVGGITGALTLARLAATAGIPYQLGALVGESALLQAATQACLQVLHPLRVETSFAWLLLRESVFTSGTTGSALSALPALGTTPGFGVAPKEKVLNRRGRLLYDLKA